MPVRQKPSRIVQNTLDMLIRKPLDLEPATGVGARRDVHHGLLVCLAIVALAGCSAPPPDESGWLENLLEHRQVMDEFFREAPDSPVPVERRGTLLPIHYYDPDSAFRVPAALEVSPEQPVFDIPTSTGEIRLMQRVGILKFALNGQPIQLSALAETPVRSIDSLFIMFKDATNQSETYAGGRYLDLPRTATGHYDLDFNRAYHPYCYYNEEFDCPYPPPENRLTLAIPAGERRAPGTSGYSPGVVPPPDDDASVVETPQP